VPFFLDTIVLKHFVQTYQSNRKIKLESWVGFIGNKVSSYTGGANSLDIDATCRDLIEEQFGKSKTPAEWIDTLLNLGHLAWRAQSLKVTNAVPALGFFMESASEFGRMLHAMRNYILAQIVSRAPLEDNATQQFRLELQQALDTKIKTLNEDRQRQEKQHYLAKKIFKSSAEDIRNILTAWDNAIRNLAYLGEDYAVITSQREAELFPGMEFPTTINYTTLNASLNKTNPLAPNPNILSILQLCFTDIYLNQGKGPHEARVTIAQYEKLVHEDYYKKHGDERINAMIYSQQGGEAPTPHGSAGSATNASGTPRESERNPTQQPRDETPTSNSALAANLTGSAASGSTSPARSSSTSVTLQESESKQQRPPSLNTSVSSPQATMRGTAGILAGLSLEPSVAPSQTLPIEEEEYLADADFTDEFAATSTPPHEALGLNHLNQESRSESPSPRR
jgi:hypothetical protein